VKSSVPSRIAPPNYYSSPERFVGAIEAARFLGVHPKTLQKYSRSGLVPAHPFGEGTRKLWRYLLSELEIWLRARSTSSSSDRPSAIGLATVKHTVDFSNRLR
jgi:hypothetical protein